MKDAFNAFNCSSPVAAEHRANFAMTVRITSAGIIATPLQTFDSKMHFQRTLRHRL